MEAPFQGISPRPSLTGWSFAFLSLLSVLALSFFTLFKGAQERKDLLVAQFERALSVRDYAVADSALQDLDAAPLPLRLGALFSAQSDLPPHGSLQTARTLIGALSAFSTQRFDEAQTRLASVPSSYDELVQGMQAKLTSVAEIQKQLIDTRQALALLDRRSEENLQQGELIAKEFGEMLSLEPEIGEDGSPPAYKMGVLAGLPRIEGLRDNIVDLNFLKVELDGLSARVRVDGEDQHAAFIGKLEQLRTSYQEVLRQYEEIESAYVSSEERTEELARQLRFSQLRVEQELRQEVRSIIKTLLSLKDA